MSDILSAKVEDLKILIVDDNPKNLQIIGSYLVMEGYSVEFATDGEKAIDWIESLKFDLILLDINMPVMDGYDVCRIIKKNPRHNKIPVIFITAKTDTDSIIKGFETGAVDYITKPFNHRELLVRVKSQIEIKRGRDQITQNLADIESRNKLISESIDYAQKIQSSVFRSIQVANSFFKEYFSLVMPRDVLSGDFLWFTKTGNKVIAGVFDCTGHGIPGALMSMLGISFLNEIVLRDNITEPHLILNCLREKIIEALGQKGNFLEVKDGMDGSIISHDTTTGKLMYSGANSHIYIISNKELMVLKSDRMPLSHHCIMKSFSSQTVDINDNDCIYILTDGYSDQTGGAENKKLGRLRLRELLTRNNHLPMNDQKQILHDELMEWKGFNDQVDDISAIGLRI